MLTLQRAPDYSLIELSDLQEPGPPAQVREKLVDPTKHWEALQQVRAWAREYLSRPHEELGREGPVCPFTPPSMRKGLFYFAVSPGRKFSSQDIRDRLLVYRDWFQELEPREGQESFFKTILILFPDLDRQDIADIIDRTQDELKPEYVANGMMLGEFHYGPPQKAGLWNPNFLPLNSPVPMLVIRHMVPTDFGFLKDRPDFIRPYLRRFEHEIPPQMRETVREAALTHNIPVPSLEDMAAVHPRVLAVLEREGVAAKVHRHHDLPEPPSGPEDVANALDWPLSRITKSLFVRCTCPRNGQNGSEEHVQYAVLVLPVDRRIDFTRVSGHFGCQGFELASAEELAALVGFTPGGVCPIGVGLIPVLLDEAVLGYPTVLVAAGEVAVEIEINPERLQAITEATVLPLAQ